MEVEPELVLAVLPGRRLVLIAFCEAAFVVERVQDHPFASSVILLFALVDGEWVLAARLVGSDGRRRHLQLRPYGSANAIFALIRPRL